jgi:Nucleoporin autopeptidase
MERVETVGGILPSRAGPGNDGNHGTADTCVGNESMERAATIGGTPFSRTGLNHDRNRGAANTGNGENNLFNDLKQWEAVWYVPKLRKLGYEVFPTIAELECMSEADLATVRRPGYGKVAWEGSVDVRGANLDDVVAIETKDVSVYQKDEEEGTKPEIGTKLNRPAVITLDGVFPREGRGVTKAAGSSACIIPADMRSWMTMWIRDDKKGK